MPMARVRRRASTVKPATAISPMKSMPNVRRDEDEDLADVERRLLVGRGAIEPTSVE